MRKVFAVTAIALLAFAGQAVASEGVSTLVPGLGQVGYADSDTAGAGSADFALEAATAVLLIGGAIALLASGDRHNEAPTSP
jgi:hypothetical protein